MNIKEAMYLCTSVLAIILLPQFFSYVLSGFFGCASAPVLFDLAIRIYVFSLVKSFVVAAGITLPLALWGYFNNWSFMHAKETALLTGISGLFLMASFLMLYIYRDVHSTLRSPIIQSLLRKLGPVHRWFTRNSGVSRDKASNET